MTRILKSKYKVDRRLKDVTFGEDLRAPLIEEITHLV